MSSDFCKVETTDNECPGFGPTSKISSSVVEKDLATVTNIEQGPGIENSSDLSPIHIPTKLASDWPTDVGLKQPHPDRHALFRDALFRLEKLIYPTDSLEPTIGPLPEEEMPDLDLSSNRFWLADQRRKAEQSPTDARSTECSASGDPSCRPSSPRSPPRTPEPEPERTPTPPHTPFATMEARLIIQLLRKFGPGGNPDGTEYGWPPTESESESGSEWDDDGVMDP